MAEWAQLRHAMLHDQLERGWWYPVLDRTHDGMVRVSVDASMAVLRVSQVRLIDHEPQTATRIRPITMAEKSELGRGARMRYVAVCPRNHDLGVVLFTDDQVECTQCDRVYELEDARMD